MAFNMPQTPDPLFISTRPNIWQIDIPGIPEQAMRVELPGVAWVQWPDIDTTGVYTFDFQEYMEDQLGFDLHEINAVGALSADNSIYGYNPQFTLLVGPDLADSGITESGGSRFVINATLQHHEAQNLDIFKLASGSPQKRFLTNAPTYKCVRMGESEFLPFYIDDAAVISVALYRADGYLIDVFQFDTGKGRADLGIGPGNLAAYSSVFDSGDTPVAYYCVQVNNIGKTYSETRCYKIDNCCYTDPTRVHFLNRLGGFDSYTFTGTERKTVSTQSTTYQRYLNDGFANKDRGKTVQARRGFERLRCSTDALTTEEYQWLEELLTSPEIYIQQHGTYCPVVISDGSFKTKNEQKNIQRLEVTFELANEIILQRN